MINSAEIRRKAVQLLLDTKVSELPIDPFAIANKLGIPIISFTDARQLSQDFEAILGELSKDNSLDAFCCSPKGSPIIFYDETVTPPERIRFSIAHELGHITLCHIHVKESLPREFSTGRKTPVEAEANAFAAELLTPQGLLFYTGLYRLPGKIKDVFKVTYSVAHNRSERLNGFMQKYVNKLEMQLCDQIFDSRTPSKAGS